MTTDRDQEKLIQILQKKLKRSEENRRLLQEIKDKNHELLNRLHAEINEAKQIIEKRNEELFHLNAALSKEKEKSDQLLLNILPVRVANDLKRTGSTRPENFDNVTVYFSDIVGFTKLSAQLEPSVLIDELNDLFTAFDKIIDANNCERIKTIGDAYMAVCGMPAANKNHAENIVRSAQQIIQYLRKRSWNNNKVNWKVRIGIHTGSIVGGVVGVKKYIYDIFGDTVNVASRMESSSEEMMINISATTYELVKDKFECIERPSLELKGKGEMRMWQVKV